MSLKRDIRVQSVVISLMVSIMTIMLMSMFLNFDLVSNSLGMQIIEMNEISTQSANSVTSVVTYFRGLDTLRAFTITFLAIIEISLGLKG